MTSQCTVTLCMLLLTIYFRISNVENSICSPTIIFISFLMYLTRKNIFFQFRCIDEQAFLSNPRKFKASDKLYFVKNFATQPLKHH